jgi:hypothetical protein
MRRLILLLALILWASVSAAQTTTVSGTVTDMNGNPYFPGTVAAALQFPSGSNPSVNPSSGPFPTTTGGNFSIVLPNNSAITPPGTVWVITLCAQTVPIPNVTQTQVCFNSLPLVVAGSFLNISSLLNPIAPVLGPSGGNGTGANLLPLNNNWTGTNNFNNTTTFNADAYFKSGAPRYDAKAFGCVGDGVTDDTACVNAMYTQILADLAASGKGGGGYAYFSHSSGPYAVRGAGLTIPFSSKGWIVSVFDNGLLVTDCNPINITGAFLAFIGDSGSFQFAQGTAIFAPSATWEQAGPCTTPLINQTASNSIYFEGINMVGESSAETWHIHDNAGSGVTWTVLNKSVIQNLTAPYVDIVADSSGSSVVSGYGLRAFLTSFVASGASTAAHPLIQINNFGEFIIRNSYLNGNITANNLGIASMGDFEFDDVLTEGLNGVDMLTATGLYVNDFTFSHVKKADNIGTSYIFNNLTTGNPNGPVKFDMTVTGNIGAGLMNPAGHYYNVSCVGAGCPGYVDTLQIAVPSAPPVATIDRTFFDTSGNIRCLLLGSSNCGAILGAIVGGSYANSAWSATSLVCTDSSSPPKIVTAGCGHGVADLTPLPFVHVNGSSGGVLQTTSEGQGPGGSNATNAPYTVLASDRFAVVTRAITAPETDVLAQAGTGYLGSCTDPTANLAFACNFTYTEWNTGTATLSVSTTGSSWTCPGYTAFCTSGAGGTMTLPPNFKATILTQDNANWVAAIQPAGIGSYIVHTSGANTNVATTTIVTTPGAGGYRVSAYVSCTSSSGTPTDALVIGANDYQSGIVSTSGGATATCTGTTTPGSASSVFILGVAAGQAITYALTKSGTITGWTLFILVEGPF